MATVAFSVTNLSETPHVKIITWVLGDADVGEPIGDAFLDFTDRTVQMTGTWDTATAVWQGSNNDTNYYTLPDAGGTGISFSADAAPRLVREMPRYQRPSSSGGGGSAAITVIATIIRRRP